MTKGDLLRRAHEWLEVEHEGACDGVGDPPPPHGTDVCDVCDLLRDIDKELEPPRNRCCGLPGYHKPSDEEYVIHPL